MFVYMFMQAARSSRWTPSSSFRGSWRCCRNLRSNFHMKMTILRQKMMILPLKMMNFVTGTLWETARGCHLGSTLAVCFVYACRRLIDLSPSALYVTCRRLIDLSPSALYVTCRRLIDLSPSALYIHAGD